MGHNINPHNVKVLSYENNTIKRRVKEAISFKQRKPSLNMDEGLDLIPPVNNPLLGIHNFSVTQQDKPLNNDEVRVIRTKYWFHFNFSLWVLEFSVLDYYSVMCGIQDFLVSLTFCAFWPVRHRVMESL